MPKSHLERPPAGGIVTIPPNGPSWWPKAEGLFFTIEVDTMARVAIWAMLRRNIVIWLCGWKERDGGVIL